jgi:AcrR family transcriptional regulator
MVMSLRERRRQMLRDEILQAARELAIEKGTITYSMDELAARVGISKPTLYSHFATKEDLIVAAAAQSMQHLLHVIDTQLSGQTPLQSLLLLMRTAIQMLFEEGVTVYRPMSPEIIKLIHSNEETYAYVQRIDDTISNLIQQGIEQGEIDPALDPPTVMLALHGLIHALRFETIHVQISEQATVIHTLLTLFERGIRCPGTSAASDGTAR